MRVADFLGDFNDMAVMGQIYGLSASSDSFHQAAGSAGAFLIKGFKHVIAEKRQLNASGCHLLVCGGSQSEIQLEPCSLRHISDLLWPVAGIDRQEDFR